MPSQCYKYPFVEANAASLKERMRCRRSVLALHSREEAKLGRFAYAALPATHFDRNKVHAISGTGR
jgi:hypothetical protein